jgi:hypothetical protein
MVIKTISGNSVLSAINRLAEKCSCLSLTRVKGLVSDDSLAYVDESRKYLDGLKCLMEKRGNVEVMSCMEGDFNYCYQYLFIIGSDKEHIRLRTGGLIEIVNACPEGPVLGEIREAYDRHWGGEPNFKKFYKKVEGQKGIIKIDKGPCFYDSRHLKEIAELILFPLTISKDYSLLDDE